MGNQLLTGGVNFQFSLNNLVEEIEGKEKVEVKMSWGAACVVQAVRALQARLQI